TRYLSYKSALDLALNDEDIRSLPEAERFVEHVSWMNQRYLDITAKLADKVMGHEDTRKVLNFLRRPDNLASEVTARLSERSEVEEGFVPQQQDYVGEEKRVLQSLSD